MRNGVKLYNTTNELSGGKLDTSIAIETKEIVSPAVAADDVICTWKVQRTNKLYWYGFENDYEIISEEYENSNANEAVKALRREKSAMFELEIGKVSANYNGKRMHYTDPVS